MKTPRLQFPFTAVAAVLAIIALLAALIGHVNLIQWPLDFLDRIEHNEIDDIVTAFLLVIVAFIVDHVVAARRSRREIGLQAERLRIVKVTMRTVQDIVNNCLNGLQLVRFEAEGHVVQESLALFDEAIQETSAKLKTLGDLEAYAENQMAVGTGLSSNKSDLLDLSESYR
jgi:hypothetical protein